MSQLIDAANDCRQWLVGGLRFDVDGLERTLARLVLETGSQPHQAIHVRAFESIQPRVEPRLELRMDVRDIDLRLGGRAAWTNETATFAWTSETATWPPPILGPPRDDACSRRDGVIAAEDPEL